MRAILAIDLRAEFMNNLVRHPKVFVQKLLEDGAARERLRDALPVFVPFGGREYHGAIWILDWDHRWPSRGLVLRFYAYYTSESHRKGLTNLENIKERIAAEEIYPEFDVSDFSGLEADEAYQAEVDEAGVLKRFRFVSPWRREVHRKIGRQAETLARKSPAFCELVSQIGARLPGLGDLEAAEWAPPSESGHTRWGVNVWYLRSFNGMMGEGTAFLVDVEEKTVVSQHDFQFRGGLT
jgi:hypothetical protein